MEYNVTSPGEAVADLDRRAKRRQADRMAAAGIHPPSFEQMLAVVRAMDNPLEQVRQVAMAALPLGPAEGTGRPEEEEIEYRPPEIRSSSGFPVVDLLQSLLAAGPRNSEDVRREVELAGISWRSTGWARKRLGIQARRVGFGRGGRWVLSLPPSP